MWQWVSTSSQRAAHSFLYWARSRSISLQDSKRGLSQTDMTVLGATSLHASRRSASDSQSASENLLRLDMYSLSTLAWLSPCSSCVKC